MEKLNEIEENWVRGRGSRRPAHGMRFFFQWNFMSESENHEEVN